MIKHNQLEISVTIRFFAPLSLALFTCFFASQIHAQSRGEFRALQYALGQHGFYDGTVDGLGGPQTRRAISGYAQGNGVANDWQAVSGKLSANITWEVEWTDAAEKAVMENLETHLIDARSARISDKILYRTSDGASACVHVNSKNAIGAYSGYEWLFYTLVEINYSKTSTLKLEDAAFAVGPFPFGARVSEALCMLGYISEKQER